ncbi:MAG: hypothetical protein SNJ71_00135 [Bacteroidales bacterium]
MAIHFNSKEYSWANVSVVLFGRPVTGVRGIQYKSNKEKELLYAAGEDPHAVQHGNRNYTGTLMLLQSELDALNASAQKAGYQDILDLDFDIVVSYKAGSKMKKDIIKFASISEFEEGMKQNDKYAEINLPFVFIGIKRG